MLLSEAWKEFELDKRLGGYAESTIEDYKLQWDLLIREIGDISIKDVAYEQLKMYIIDQKQIRNLMASSVNHREKSLRSVFRWAHENGYISVNPASRLKGMKEPKTVPKGIPTFFLETIRESCKTSREHALVEIFFNTGCRLAEIQKLNINDIKWETRSIIVNGKGSKEREVMFTERAEFWIKKYLESRKDEHPALFVVERRPYRHLSKERMREIIKEIAKRTGMNINVYPHRFRHSFCQHLIDRGMPMEIVQQLAGHKKIDTTRRYCQHSGEQLRAAYKQYM